MEVNANPSLNIYTPKESPTGAVEYVVSEIDRFVKTGLIQDTLSLVQSAPLFSSKLKDPQTVFKHLYLPEVGQLKHILTGNEHSELYLYSRIENLFRSLQGQKVSDSINLNQFQRLSLEKGMTNSNLTKAHYYLIFKNVCRRVEAQTLDLVAFSEAIQEIAAKLFSTSKRSHYEHILDTLAILDN